MINSTVIIWDKAQTFTSIDEAVEVKTGRGWHQLATLRTTKANIARDQK